MKVLGVNKILNWCQVFSNGRRYTCQTKKIDGQLCFYFKKSWHLVSEYIADTAGELVYEKGKSVFRNYQK